MSDETLELTIEEATSTTEEEVTGDVWELMIETGERGPAGPPGSGGTTDHGALTGLTDPDHPSTAITVPDDTLPMFDPDTIYAEVYAACITAGASTGASGAIATVAASYISDQPDTVHAALINASKLLGPILANSALAGNLATAAIPKGLIGAKGDLVVGTADDTPDRLAVGSNGYILVADSGEATGVKWAVPTNGVRSMMRDGYAWTTISGSQSWITDTGTAQGGGYVSNGAVNDYTEYVDHFDAGTWTLDWWYLSSPSNGIVTLTLDGTGLGSTIDGYTAGTVRNNRATRTGIVVSTSGLHTLRVSVLSKNGSSSSYRSGTQHIAWRRTA